MNKGQVWEKDEGDYFPEWLRNMVVALVSPVPPLMHVLDEVKDVDGHPQRGDTYAQWRTMGSYGTVGNGIGSTVALNPDGSLFYGGEVGSGALFRNYKDFHKRRVAMKVSLEIPEVTAQVTVLEDLSTVATDFFDASASGGVQQSIDMVVLKEDEIRKSLLIIDPPIWPTVVNGPTSGSLISKIVIDRNGMIREVDNPIGNNPAVHETAKEWIAKQRFRPYLVNGVPVQVVTTFTLAFKTKRPEGVEDFDSSKIRFDKGRVAGFPAAGDKPYILRADFTTRSQAGQQLTGRYTDSWQDAVHWRREATFGASHVIRTRDGEKFYQQTDGPDAKLLATLFYMMEPIPDASDGFAESDWRMRREELNGVKVVRMAVGSDEDIANMAQGFAKAFWFDDDSRLIRAMVASLQIDRSNFTHFNGTQVARNIDIRSKNGFVMQIRVIGVDAAVDFPKDEFKLSGHEYPHNFTPEVR